MTANIVHVANNPINDLLSIISDPALLSLYNSDPDQRLSHLPARSQVLFYERSANNTATVNVQGQSVVTTEATANAHYIGQRTIVATKRLQ